MSLKIISPNIVYLGSAKAPSSSGSGELPQLYDTRILSSASAPEGWAYTCSNAYRTFSSSELPTLYNDINTKLQNSTTEDIIIENKNIGTYNEQQILYCNNTYYQGSYYYNNGSWTNVGLSNIVASLTDNTGSIIIAVDEDTAVYKINPLNNEYKKIANSSPLSLIQYYFIGNNGGLFKKEYNNTLYVSKGDNNYICEIKSNYSDNTFITYSFNEIILDYEFVNNYWYLLTYNPVWDASTDNYVSYYNIYKGNDLSNNDLTDTTKWELVYTNNYPNINVATQLLYYNGRFIVFGSSNYEDGTTMYFYTDDEFNTVSNIFVFPVLDSNILIRISKNFLLFSVFDSIYYCEINKINSLNNWRSIDIELQGQPTLPLSFPINSIMYFMNDTTNHKIHTISLFYGDEYIINNSSIYINYCKYENFKICQYSDLTLLNQLYTQYGISNYWNIYNNTVSIPIDSQQYKIIYVGDNFNDDLYNS